MHEKLLTSTLFSSQSEKIERKILLLGSVVLPEGKLPSWLRSLNTIEHVSPSDLIGVEISRGTDPKSVCMAKAVAGKTIIAAMRRWFFTRKPDAGFVLKGFPATLLQARLFDEWLDARGENLDAVIPLADAEKYVVEHYRTLGLLLEDDL